MSESVWIVLINLVLCMTTVISQNLKPGCPSNCFCTNGVDASSSITQASCSGSIPPRVPDTLKYLVTRNSKIPSLSPFMFENHQFVEALQLSQCGIEDIQPATFSAMKNVKIIKLSYNKLSQIQSVMFDGLTGLREFYCDNNQIRFIEDKAFGKLSQLEVLDVHNNQMYQMPTGLPTKLQSLNLEGNFIEYIPNGAIGSDMKRLNLCGNRLHQVSFDTKQNTNLSQLCVGNMPSIISLATFENLQQLKELSLSCEMSPNSILPENVQNGIKSLVGLELLSLSYYRLDDLQFLVPLKKLHTLRLKYVMMRTNLSEAVFKDKRQLINLDLGGSPYLAQGILASNVILQQLHSLQTLGLSDCQIHTIDANTWTQNMLNINQLDLSNNPLHCDCRLKWIVMHEKDRPIHFIDEKVTTCATPPEYANKPVTSFTFQSCFMHGTPPSALKPGDVPISSAHQRNDSGAVVFPDENSARTRKSLIVVISILAILLAIVIIAFIIYACCVAKKKKKMDTGTVAYKTSKDSLLTQQ